MSLKTKIKIDIEETLIHGSILLPLLKSINLNYIFNLFQKEKYKHSTLYHSYVQDYLIEINISNSNEQANFYEMLTYYKHLNGNENSLSSLCVITDSNNIMSSSFVEFKNNYLEKNAFKYNVYEYDSFEQIDIIFDNGCTLIYPDKYNAPGTCSYKSPKALQTFLSVAKNQL